LISRDVTTTEACVGYAHKHTMADKLINQLSQKTQQHMNKVRVCTLHHNWGGLDSRQTYFLEYFLKKKKKKLWSITD